MRELRILILEDQQADAELCERELRAAGLRFTSRRVDSRDAFEAVLEAFAPDLIISDFTLEGAFDGLAALRIARARAPKVPVVFLSGTIGEERAVEVIKHGAADYVLKNGMARLAAAVAQALERARLLSEKERTEGALQASEQRFRAIFDNVGVGITLRPAHARHLPWTQVNDHFCRLLGYAREEVLKLSTLDITPPEEHAGSVRDNARLLGGDVASYSREKQIVRKDGRRIWVYLTVASLPGSDGRPESIIATYQDITQRREAEISVRRLNRVYAVLSSTSALVARVRDIHQLQAEACRIAVEQGKFELAWIGRHDPGKGGVVPVVWAGADAEKLTHAGSSARSDNPLGLGVTGGAVRKKAPVFVNDLAAEPDIRSERRREVVRLGYRSSIGLPLIVDGEAVGALTLYAREPNFFDDAEVGLLAELAGNISIGMESIARQQKIEKLSRIRSVSSEINAAIARIRDREALLRETCRIAFDHGRFGMVWVGAVDAARQEVGAVAWKGFSEQTARKVSWDSVHRARGTLGEAIRTGKPAVRNDIEAELPGGGMRSEAVEQGCRSTVCLPLVVDGAVAALVVLFAAGIGFFDEDELALLGEMTADVSLALQSIARQERLDYLSYYDPLTGLSNRTLFLDRASQQMRTRGGEPLMVALILVNLERFRNINDTLGRSGGDDLLRLVTRRLETAFRGKDLLARVGPDDFGVVVRGIRDSAAVAYVLQNQVLGCFRELFDVGGKELRVAAKAGIAMYPVDGNDADVLFSNAEAALRQAKESGERYLFYAPEMNARAAQALSLETRLRKAIEAEQFTLHYQPKIALADGRLRGLEALIRWHDPQSGLVAPGTFIPLLEETGLILDVGKWALARALADHRRWTEQGCTAPRVAVNVSAIQLQQRDFADVVANVVQERDGSPHALELEITESLLMKDVQTSIRKLSILQGMGIHITIDDFGTGYSSLSYIARLPINSLKIDRSFVAGMAGNPQDMSIVTTIIALAHSLNLHVVAEGVETAEQSKLLGLLKCDEGQGYFFSKPMPADRVPLFIETHGRSGKAAG